MSTTSLPLRTRSLRKPLERGSALVDTTQQDVSTQGARNSQSPTRLPTMSRRTARTASDAGHGSGKASTVTRGPSVRGDITNKSKDALGRKTSVSRPETHADPIKQDRSRPPITTSRHLRQTSSSTTSALTGSSTHTRNKSLSSLSGARPSLRPASRVREGDVASKAALSEQTEHRRPAFSALQQHFSPAKNLAPKPHLAAFLAPPSPSKLPVNIALSAATTRLQSELLQLHLLHQDADQVALEWNASAKRKLRDKFEHVAQQRRRVADMEEQRVAQINAMALHEWEQVGAPGMSLEEKIQVLSESLTGVWNLSEPDGRYERLVRRFERWLSRCHTIRESRNRNHEPPEDMMFVEPLDEKWKGECRLLKRKVEGWHEQLQHLGTLPEGSSVAQVINGCHTLVRGVQAELATMTQIEHDAVTTENAWIRSMNDDNASDQDDTPPPAGAIWRAF